MRRERIGVSGNDRDLTVTMFGKVIGGIDGAVKIVVGDIKILAGAVGIGDHERNVDWVDDVVDLAIV